MTFAGVDFTGSFGGLLDAGLGGLSRLWSPMANSSWSPMLLQSSETREEFDWGHLPEMWVVFLVVVPLVLLFVALVYRRENPSGGGATRWLLAGLRAAVILALLTFLAQPILRRVTVQTRDPQLIVLVDDSLSMGIADKFSDRSIPQRLAEALDTSSEVVEGTPRLALVNRVLADTTEDGGKNLVERLREKMAVSVYTFAGDVRRVKELPKASDEAEDAEAFTGIGSATAGVGSVDERTRQTNIGEAVFNALRDHQATQGLTQDHGVAGVVVFTDGQNNAGVVQPEEMASRLRQRGIPLLVVGVGNPDAPKNIRVVSLDVENVVLVGDDVSFDASIVSEGFEGDNVQVDLIFGDETVDTKYVNVQGGGEREVVRLHYKPTRPGDFTATVKVEPQRGEIFEEDNIFSRPVTVLDQKIKILYVEDLPRWEYRYLKNALIRDPTMEAHILLYDADRDFRQESSPGLAPLVEFPSKKEDLFKYHVIIIGDLDPSRPDPRGTPFFERLELIQQFVGESGGGVVFLAGPNANPHAYLNTPLYPLLPVEVEKPTNETYERPFAVKLTGAGKEHPVLRLENDRESNTERWEKSSAAAATGQYLSGFYWFARVKKPKLAAISLAYHPEEKLSASDQNVPIFVIQNYSKGSVFYCGVDETWRWRAGVDNLYFYRFWGQVIRYASSGRLRAKTPRYSIATDKQIYTIGETLTIDCRVYDANMEPSTEPRVTVYHAVKGREDEPPEAIELELNPSRGPGSYEGTLVAGQLGNHDLWLGSAGERLAFVTYVVEVPPLEFRDTRLDADRLKKVAGLAKGKYYELYEFKAAVDFLSGSARPRQIPIEERQDDLWDEYWVLLVFTGVIAAEWILRKWVRLL